MGGITHIYKNYPRLTLMSCQISIKIIKILRVPKQLLSSPCSTSHHLCMSSHPSCKLDESLFHCVPGRIVWHHCRCRQIGEASNKKNVSIPTIVEFDGLHNDDLGEEQVLTLKIITKSWKPYCLLIYHMQLLHRFLDVYACQVCEQQ